MQIEARHTRTQSPGFVDPRKGRLTGGHRLAQMPGHTVRLAERREHRYLQCAMAGLLRDILRDLDLAHVLVGTAPCDEDSPVRLDDESVAHHVVHSGR